MIWIIILILVIIIFILALALFLIIKKTNYLSKKEKDMLMFVIDMYINYAEELELLTDKHPLIVTELKKLKDKLEKNE